MAQFLGIALGFPMAIYTGLAALSIVYWLSVLIGAVHLSFEGADGAMDGAADGIGGHEVGDVGGHHDGGDLDGGHDGADGEIGHHAGLLNALKLRSAPLTLVASIVFFFSWVLGMFGVAGIESAGLAGGALIAAKLAVLVFAPVVSLFPTSVVIRPLARTMKPIRATKHAQLVGKLCTIRTGTVTDRFGEATLDDGGSGLVVRVRVETGDKLGRGDQAVIVGYDEDRQEFTVAPMPDANAR